MADKIYKVRDPSGAIREIRGPEGATEAEVIAQAKKLLTKSPVAEQDFTDFTSGMSFGENLLAGTGKGMTDVVRGAGQVVGLGPSRLEMDEIKRRDAPLMESGGGKIGNVAGNVAMMAPAMMIPGGQTVAGSTLLGAGSGLIQPVGTEDSRTLNTAVGAGFGLAVPLGVSGVKAAGRGIRNVIDPMLPGGIARAAGRTARAAAGDRTDDIVRLLMENKKLVPGSAPTAAEVAAPVGAAEFSGLQHVVQGQRPSAFSDIARINEGARSAAIRTVGQTPKALSAAETARSVDALRNYAAAYGTQIKADPKLLEISQNPYFKDALPDALKLAKAKGITMKNDLTRVLHFVKLSLDKTLSKTGDTALSKTEKGAVGEIKNELVKWLGEKNPAYAKAREEFAKASIPINQMQVGQELQKALTSTLGTAERPSTFASAATEAARTIKRATGSPRFEALDEVLSPKQAASVKGVMADLARSGENERLARFGTEKARTLVGQTVPEAPSAGMFSPAYSVARAIFNRISGKLEGASVERLAKAFEDPTDMAQLMGKLPSAKRQVLVEAIKKYASTAAVTGPTAAYTGGH